MKRLTTKQLQQMSREGQRLAMLTAYDYTMARIIDGAGVDMILIGDSAANVICGLETTLPITLDEMIFLARNVRRGVEHALVVCDMPFGSYQTSDEEGLRSAVRIMKETGVDAVKLEGGARIVPLIRRIVEAGIPVCGHLGLTPQSVHALGGYGIQGKDASAAETLLHDVAALRDAGCFACVLEKIPAALTQKAIAVAQDMIVIGIGAGAADAQVLVSTDMLGMAKSGEFNPKFVRRFGEIHAAATAAVADYVTCVRNGSFPSPDESY